MEETLYWINFIFSPSLNQQFDTWTQRQQSNVFGYNTFIGVSPARLTIRKANVYKDSSFS
jgi:hypothetical protein